METNQVRGQVGYGSEFPAYLQGMETSHGHGLPAGHGARSQPTYKEWKLSKKKAMRFALLLFPAYLQGMETGSDRNARGRCKEVPSLPTRNGNRTMVRINFFFMSSSQPTYKEWKLMTLTLLPSVVPSVPSLPTRNGNSIIILKHWLEPLVFPAYLQGMETELRFNASHNTFRVPSLPTRNGNAQSGLPSVCGFRRSQPTYKEWKRRGPVPGKHRHLGSQPTYKEWKLPDSP